MTPSWESTGLWWLKLAGFPMEAAQGPGAVPMPWLVDTVTGACWTSAQWFHGLCQATLPLLPSLLSSMPPAMPWIFACILDYIFFFSLSSSRASQSVWGRKQGGENGVAARMEKGRRVGTGSLCHSSCFCLLAGRGLLLGLRRGTIISPSVLLF